MKLLTTTLLATSVCLSAVFPADAGNIVGSVKAWEYMQADGWKSADGMDDNTLHNMLYQANVIDNYPWTKQFLLRTACFAPFRSPITVLTDHVFRF